jgi:CMP-N-acetylneuraminic acid synthetase
MNILITICARGGSKGIPGKNIKLIAGKPLIAYTIEVAKKLGKKHNIKIALSTDDSEILKVSKTFGVTTNYIRPASMATDVAGKMDAIRDVLKYEETLLDFKYDFVLDLDVTSPFRTLQDLENALEIIKNNPEAKNLFSVNNANRNPYFNMVEQKSNGFYSLIKTNPDGSVLTRQSAPKVYDMNASFYYYKRSFFDTDGITALTDKSLIYLMDHICFDLDHPIDFLFMEFLLVNNKLDFEL